MLTSDCSYMMSVANGKMQNGVRTISKTTLPARRKRRMKSNCIETDYSYVSDSPQG